MNLRFLFLLLITTCSVVDKSHYGRVELYNGSSDRSSFVFTVSDEFSVAHKDSPQDQKNPKITQDEALLLTSLLKEKGFCLNRDGVVDFEITSRQEKVYDATFAHLIEENYRARPLTPKMYAGRCQLKKVN